MFRRMQSDGKPTVSLWNTAPERAAPEISTARPGECRETQSPGGSRRRPPPDPPSPSGSGSMHDSTAPPESRRSASLCGGVGGEWQEREVFLLGVIRDLEAVCSELADDNALLRLQLSDAGAAPRGGVGGVAECIRRAHHRVGGLHQPSAIKRMLRDVRAGRPPQAPAPVGADAERRLAVADEMRVLVAKIGRTLTPADPEDEANFELATSAHTAVVVAANDWIAAARTLADSAAGGSELIADGVNAANSVKEEAQKVTRRRHGEPFDGAIIRKLLQDMTVAAARVTLASAAGHKDADTGDLEDRTRALLVHNRGLEDDEEIVRAKAASLLRQRLAARDMWYELQDRSDRLADQDEESRVLRWAKRELTHAVGARVSAAQAAAAKEERDAAALAAMRREMERDREYDREQRRRAQEASLFQTELRKRALDDELRDWERVQKEKTRIVVAQAKAVAPRCREWRRYAEPPTLAELGVCDGPALLRRLGFAPPATPCGVLTSWLTSPVDDDSFMTALESDTQQHIRSRRDALDARRVRGVYAGPRDMSAADCVQLLVEPVLAAVAKDLGRRHGKVVGLGGEAAPTLRSPYGTAAGPVDFLLVVGHESLPAMPVIVHDCSRFRTPAALAEVCGAAALCMQQLEEKLPASVTTEVFACHTCGWEWEFVKLTGTEVSRSRALSWSADSVAVLRALLQIARQGRRMTS